MCVTVGFSHHGQVQVNSGHGAPARKQHLRQCPIKSALKCIGLFGLQRVGFSAQVRQAIQVQA